MWLELPVYACAKHCDVEELGASAALHCDGLDRARRIVDVQDEHAATGDVPPARLVRIIRTIVRRDAIAHQLTLVEQNWLARANARNRCTDEQKRENEQSTAHKP